MPLSPSPVPPYPPPLSSGLLYHAHNGLSVGSAVNPTDQQARFSPLVVTNQGGVVLSGIAIFTVTTQGAVNAVNRLGIYRDNGSGKPGSLVIDAGTVDETAALGLLEIAISITLPPGLYWLVSVPQGAPATHATLRNLATVAETAALTTTPAGITGVWFGTIAGALPASAPALTGTTVAYMVLVRTA